LLKSPRYWCMFLQNIRILHFAAVTKKDKKVLIPTCEDREMEKIQALNYRGIEYIRLRDLPKFQKDHLIQWGGEGLAFIIQKESYKLDDCILYSDYSYWFDKFLLDEEFSRENPKKNGISRDNSIDFALE